ncbi:hypothetical protein CTEN210_12002 [Chaetoceros tenuissimus]|uniref:F-box domain-containing protein n=1 Tax=Chaetoceros tenuissimus TaxID=426638 RepID=A0AAD3D0E1_9STRA|nr:hypothetical protein CTEN210_12002 [Chaetoceros tenuissimus]
MSSTEACKSAPAKKRAKTTMENTSDSLASFDVNKRANELSEKISSLCNEFPEMKYILDSFQLQDSLIKAAVQKYKDDMVKNAEMEEAKHSKAEMSPLHSLPDEVLQICLSYIGGGNYGSVALTSKKLHNFYKEEFGRDTAYLEMATSVKLAYHCLDNLCKCLNEKDELFRAAAVNGNVVILKAAVKDGYDLFPLIEMKKDAYEDCYLANEEEGENGITIGEYEPYDVDIYYTDEDGMSTCENKTSTYMMKTQVKLSQLVARGHLHVLKYLHEELNYRKGLQRYIKPAIQHDQVEILKWLHSIDPLNEDDVMNRDHYDSDECEIKPFYFCDCAVKSGSVEVLHWLLDQGYKIDDEHCVMGNAISSKSLEMIQFCFDKGYSIEESEHRYDIKDAKSVEMYRFLHELGFEFTGGINTWVNGYCIEQEIDILKFLRSISIPWDDKIMKDIAAYGTLEIVKYAHGDGCPWTSDRQEYANLLVWQNNGTGMFSGGKMHVNFDEFEKLQFLIENGCTFNHEYPCDFTKRSLMEVLRKKKDLAMLQYFIGENSKFYNQIFKYFLQYSTREDLWCEGICCILEKGKDVEKFKSIEELLNKFSHAIDFVKYCHSQGLPWCKDPSGNTHLLSRIACYNDLDDVKWAYENGCKGDQSFPYIKEEWEEKGIRQRDEWRANCHFFEENDMLPNMNLLEDEDEGEDELRSDLVGIDNSELKCLVDGGLSFRSEEEKEAHLSQALEKCFEHSYGGHGENINNRKRLALFQQMRVKEPRYPRRTR